jgi:hypothetical protein
MKYPFLPYRAKNGMLLFVLGKWRGSFTFLELRKALKIGYKILKCYKAFKYTKTFYPFKKYVNDLYKKRMKYKAEGNEIMQYATKILLNSLYGKFATRPLKETIFVNLNKEKCPIGFMPIYDKMIAYKNVIKYEDDMSYVHPIFSAMTTAYGRIKLYDAITDLDAIYCDTDSIISRKKIDDNKELGELKLEKTIIKGIIIRAKAYSFNDDVKFKGMRHVSLKNFEDILNGNAVEQTKFVKIKESLAQGLSPNEIKTFLKRNDLDDKKRVWHKKFDKDEFQESTPFYVNNPDKNELLDDQVLDEGFFY